VCVYVYCVYCVDCVSCRVVCSDIIIIIMVVMTRSVGWWAGQSELQRTSGGHRTKCALRNRVLYFTTCVWICGVLLLIN
jgi:hypothetical protein